MSFVHKKYGVVILLALSITQILVGDGWVIDLTLITCILATRIDKPLNWWRSHLPPQLRLWFAKLFPSSLVQIITSGFSVLRISLTF